MTRLGAYGGPRPPYGSFAGKSAAGRSVAHITRLGAYGGARPPYASFAGKASGAVGHPVGHIARLGMHGGPRPLYASFAGKTPTEIVTARQITRQHSLSGKMAIGI